MFRNKKTILLIGADSKLALKFLDKFENQRKYKIYKTYHSSKKKINSSEFIIDLRNEDEIRSLIVRLSNIQFDSVLFFASVYKKDGLVSLDLLKQYKEDVNINAFSFSYLCRNLKLSNSSKIIAFGDAGISHPKNGYTSYSLSKLVLEGVVKILSVELCPNTSVNLISLGPSFTLKDNKDYYLRSLLKIEKPYESLVSLIDFMISEDNLNITGTTIAFDGGTYLNRK